MAVLAKIGLSFPQSGLLVGRKTKNVRTVSHSSRTIYHELSTTTMCIGQTDRQTHSNVQQKQCERLHYDTQVCTVERTKMETGGY